MFMALFVVYGFDTAGTFGEETLDASRQAPRGVLWSVAISGIVGTVFLLAVILAIPDVPAAMGQALPDRRHDPATLTYEIVGRHHRRRDLPVRHPDLGLRVHPGHPGRGDADDVLDEPRPAPAAAAAIWGSVNATFKTPANAAIAVGVLAAIPILVIGPGGGFSVSIAATGLIYLSYLLCNIGVLAARFRGWPHKPAWFSLGRWGKLVNILAPRSTAGSCSSISPSGRTRGCSATSAGTGRAITNPTIDTFIKPFGNEIAGMPAWPVFETLVIVLIVAGALYYVVSVRGRAADVETADAVTGEAVIG